MTTDDTCNTDDTVYTSHVDDTSNTVNTVKESKQLRQKITLDLYMDLLERARNAAYWNPTLTLMGLVNQGLRLALEDIEKEGPYPPRRGPLKTSVPRNEKTA